MQDHKSTRKTGQRDEWHGWRVKDANLHVGELPGRKSIVLYTHTHGGSVIHPLADFKTPDDARMCLDFLDTLAGSRFILDTLEDVPQGGES